MAETRYTQFRYGERTLADLAALAASAGSITQAGREAVAYWRQAVVDAGRLNAEELSAEDWHRLAHLNVLDWPDGRSHDEEERAMARDWSQYLALNLSQAYEGRAIVLPGHKAEKVACDKLARRIAGWGQVRGYAVMACLRYFWGDPQRELPEKWWSPDVWLTPKGEGAT